MQSNIPIEHDLIDYNDVISEIFSISFILMMITVNIRLRSESSNSTMVFSGLCCLLVGHCHDLLDEFVLISAQWISMILENLANNLGVVIISIAIFRWSSHYKNQLAILQRQKIELTKASHTDSLSKLYNRRFLHSEFIDQIKNAYEPEQKLSLIMIDLDRFKEINDTYGHLEGDKLIMHMAQIIRDEIRACDYAFRYGGEEFLIVLDADMSTARHVAERIRKTYQESEYYISDERVNKSTSIGIVEYSPRHNFENALDIADKALYQAKNKGRNQVIIADGSKTKVYSGSPVSSNPVTS
ncbi:GGDEF domain-containing protein [Paraneptunicella aestuarii]|uniref:GGDEF domain-containing protein n=1 Tax=Paraneptunicella aestuarii TaxID=2831148 RepID=UPI001E4CF1C4|nr:GGDEF domain-containing protein [Paraneptunicella aestuarii]UAA40510.1 GGDEF domain-containing protein [Paraneptunicella aestuarii]